MNPEVQQLHSRAKSLSAKFELEGGGSHYIDEAIKLDREALELCPPAHPMRSLSLTWLSVHLSNRYDQLGVTKDLEEAIILDREALGLYPERHRGRLVPLNNLAVHLSTRFKRVGTMQDPNEAIALSQEVLDLCPPGHPRRSSSLSNLANNLSARYQQLGTIQDLDEAIVFYREALCLCPQGHPNHAESLHDLSIRLAMRYRQLGAARDFDESIGLCREALDLRPQGHPLRSSSLSSLAGCLSDRYDQLGAIQDLDEAIVLDREALRLRPRGHPLRFRSLNNLATRLATRYDQLGEMQNLDEAVILDREAFDLHPQGHPGRSILLHNLAVHVSTRHHRLGTIQDLYEAIIYAREALSLRPQGHPLRFSTLNILAIYLFTHYKHFGKIQDLEEAIALDREALDLCPQGQPDRSGVLYSLAVSLADRYEKLGAMQDLDEAIVLDREALILRPKQHPKRPISLNNLAAKLSVRYKQVGAVQDLDEAITLIQDALERYPLGHPKRSDSLHNLAYFLLLRGEASQDHEELFGLYAQLVNVTQTASPSDLSAARAWIRVAEYFQHPTLLLAYETSLRLLVQHLATLPSLPQHLSILKNQTSSLAVDAFSAGLRKRAPATAVELLEQGRGVFWSQLTRLRSPLDDVVASGPEGKTLADEFTRLASLIRNTLDSPSVDQHERVCHLNLEMQRIVSNIRGQPGLSRFLLPPLFLDLQRAASGGPVIIVNASKHSCDALLVFVDRDPVHIPLQVTQEDVLDLAMQLRTLAVRATKVDMTRELASFLRKIWDQIVSPIIDFLQTVHPIQSRIWWCPTAEFSVLPLHAAGPFRKGQRNLPDLYISSYTPTLSALIRARRQDPLNIVPEQKCFIAIGQATAVGETELLSVGAELKTIGQCIDGLATFTHVDGEKSCISRVVEELGKNEWVHLACHGLPDRKEPFESAFALHDGHFTIQRIIRCDLKNPEFAYLSACHTTVGDEESPDEVIHLASAMQFAGFRSVIGTMWAVDDGATNKITSTFYKHMVNESGCLDHTRAAYALNKTMKSVNIPFDQRILYIHLGA